MCLYLVISQKFILILKKLKKYFMQDFLDVAEAVTEHLSIQLDNPSIGLDEQVFLSFNEVTWNDNRFRTDYILGFYIFDYSSSFIIFGGFLCFQTNSLCNVCTHVSENLYKIWWSFIACIPLANIGISILRFCERSGYSPNLQHLWHEVALYWLVWMEGE